MEMRRFSQEEEIWEEEEEDEDFELDEDDSVDEESRAYDDEEVFHCDGGDDRRGKGKKRKKANFRTSKVQEEEEISLVKMMVVVRTINLIHLNIPIAIYSVQLLHCVARCFIAENNCNHEDHLSAIPNSDCS